MTEPAQVAKSVTHVPGRKCNPCIGTFRNRTERYVPGTWVTDCSGQMGYTGEYAMEREFSDE